MTVAYRLPNSEYVRIVIKGAPEYIVPLCTYITDPSGEFGPFLGNDYQGQDHLENVVSNIAKQGFKPLTLAYRDIDVYSFEQLVEQFGNFESPEGRERLE